MSAKTLESIGAAKQQYTSTLEAKNVFVPKTSASVAKGENLAGDFASLLGITKVALQTANQYTEDGIRRLATDKYNTVAEVIQNVDGQSKLKGADYQAGIATASEAFSDGFVSFDNPEHQKLFDSIYTDTAKRGLTNITYSLLSKQEARDEVELRQHIDKNLYTNPMDLSPEFVNSQAKELSAIPGEDGHKAYVAHVDAITRQVNNIMTEEGEILLLDSKGLPDKGKVDLFMNKAYGNYLSMEKGKITWKVEDERIKQTILNSIDGINTGLNSIANNKQANMNKGMMDWAKYHSSIENYKNDDLFYKEFKATYPNATEADYYKVENYRVQQRSLGVDQVAAYTSDVDFVLKYTPENVRNTTAFKNRASKEVQSLLHTTFNQELPDNKRAEAFDKLGRAVTAGNANSFIEDLAQEIAYSPDPKEAIQSMGVLLSTTGGYTAMIRATNESMAETTLLKIAYFKQTGHMPQDKNIDELKKKTYKPTEEMNDLLRRLDGMNISDKGMVSKKVRLLYTAGFPKQAEEIVKSHEEAYEPIGKKGRVILDGPMSELKSNNPVRDERGEIIITAESYQKFGDSFIKDSIANDTMLSPAAKKGMLSSGYVLEQDPFSPTSFILRSVADVGGQNSIMIDFIGLESFAEKQTKKKYEHYLSMP